MPCPKTGIQAAIRVIAGECGQGRADGCRRTAANNDFSIRLNRNGERGSQVIHKAEPEVGSHDTALTEGWIEMARLCGGARRRNKPHGACQKEQERSASQGAKGVQ